MTDIKPVAFVNLELWLSGNCWPDDCFNEAKTGNIESPLYPESALLQAREEGRREGMREAADDWVTKEHFDALVAANLPVPIRIARVFDKSIDDAVKKIISGEANFS